MKKFVVWMKTDYDVDLPYKMAVYAKDVLIYKRYIKFYKGTFGLPTFETVAAFEWGSIYGFCEVVNND